jgi:hypothetical protein
MDKFASIMSTYAPPAISGGQRGDTTLHAANIACSNPDPLSAEIALQFGWGHPALLFETFVNSIIDVAQGWAVEINGTKYNVKGVMKWADAKTPFTHLYLELIVNRVAGD